MLLLLGDLFFLFLSPCLPRSRAYTNVPVACKLTKAEPYVRRQLTVASGGASTNGRCPALLKMRWSKTD